MQETATSAGDTVDRHKLWQPGTAEGPQAPKWTSEPPNPPNNGILITLDERGDTNEYYAAADENVLARALDHTGWLPLCILGSHNVAAAREHARLVDYRIEYEHDGSVTVLEPNRDAISTGCTPAPAPREPVARISVRAVIEHPDGSREEHLLPVDVAITNPMERWPDEYLVVLAEDTPRLDAEQLAGLLEQSLFCPYEDTEDDSRETQLARFQDSAHAVATNLLLSRSEALEAQTKRMLDQLIHPRLHPGEVVEITLRRMRGTGGKPAVDRIDYKAPPTPA